APPPHRKWAGQSASYPACAPGAESTYSPSSLVPRRPSAFAKTTKKTRRRKIRGRTGERIILAYSPYRSYRPDQSRRKGMSTWFTRCATALVMAALASATALADPIPPGGQGDRLKVI